MSENPLFSVLISCYNTEKYIAETIESLLKQTYQNFEVIIIDDASTDDSLCIIKSFADPRIKIFRNPSNMGVGYSFNRCVSLASGVLAGFVGSDDTLELNALEIMVRAHQANPKASLIYSTHYVCDENLNIRHKNENVGPIPQGHSYLTYSEIKPYSISSFASFIVSNLKKAGLDTSLKKAIDQDQYYKLEEMGETVFVDKPLYYYRHHSSNISLASNAWTARYFETRSKESAFHRRKGKTIPNLTPNELKKEWYEVLKNWALESLVYKNPGKLIRVYWIFLVRFKSLPGLARFIYYTIKRHYSPSAFYLTGCLCLLCLPL
jgi:glycosyltransferase involved in cell wall biosynthesis